MRADTEREVAEHERDGVGIAIMAERELAFGLLAFALRSLRRARRPGRGCLAASCGSPATAARSRGARASPSTGCRNCGPIVTRRSPGHDPTGSEAANRPPAPLRLGIPGSPGPDRGLLRARHLGLLPRRRRSRLPAARPDRRRQPGGRHGGCLDRARDRHPRLAAERPGVHAQRAPDPPRRPSRPACRVPSPASRSSSRTRSAAPAAPRPPTPISAGRAACSTSRPTSGSSTSASRSCRRSPREQNYRAGRQALLAYNQRLAAKGAIFDVRTDSLAATLDRIAHRPRLAIGPDRPASARRPACGRSTSTPTGCSTRSRAGSTPTTCCCASWATTSSR